MPKYPVNSVNGRKMIVTSVSRFLQRDQPGMIARESRVENAHDDVHVVRRNLFKVRPSARSEKAQEQGNAR